MCVTRVDWDSEEKSDRLEMKMIYTSPEVAGKHG
jgi:hypothetical protein